jgi:hypothetical protein
MITRSLPGGNEGGVGSTLADSCVMSSGIMFASAADVVAVPYAGDVCCDYRGVCRSSHVAAAGVPARRYSPPAPPFLQGQIRSNLGEGGEGYPLLHKQCLSVDANYMWVT